MRTPLALLSVLPLLEVAGAQSMAFPELRRRSDEVAAMRVHDARSPVLPASARR